MRILRLFGAIFAAVILLSGCAPTPVNVEVSNAWVRASEYSDSVGGMTGVFAEIRNDSDQAVKLIGGSTDAAGMVEVHEVVNGMMQKKSGGIEIAAHSSVLLEPGGLHVMLMGLKNAIKPGDEISVTLDFESADSVTLKLLAKTADAGDEDYFNSKK